MSIVCRIYRCARQADMYLYLREDLVPDALPGALLARTGRLAEVMRLVLDGRRRLARADAAHVAERLRTVGWYLQMPPSGVVDAHLHDGD